jgi:hypothetical protein
MPAQPSSNILAVVYIDGLAADKFLASWGYVLRATGLSVAGLVQLNTFERDPGKYDKSVTKGGQLSAAEFKDEIEFMGLSDKINDTSQFFTNDLIGEINDFDAEKIRKQAREFVIPQAKNGG